MESLCVLLDFSCPGGCAQEGAPRGGTSGANYFPPYHITWLDVLYFFFSIQYLDAEQKRSIIEMSEYVDNLLIAFIWGKM